ncbi:hypothetical protein [Robertmurraya korlensis]|uniref:hypothetical protein n=1 Tax=Robertmurraya korlensis TaxID=519977 RepID=UPI000826DF85|nr:hypothetical protein [Robertmurraya korlensis]
MNKNFLNEVECDQEVIVMEDYLLIEDINLLEEYPFSLYLPASTSKAKELPETYTLKKKELTDFWKVALKEQFIKEVNFHRDLLFRSSKTIIQKWADYKKIDEDLLLTSLKKYAELESSSHQVSVVEELYALKLGSPLNDPLIFGVKPDSLAKIPKTYNLQDAHSLYTELAKLDVFDIKSLMRFSKHFGMPSGIEDDRGFDVVLYGDNIFFPFSSISVLNKKIAIYKHDFEWFKMIQTKNVPKIRTLLPKIYTSNNDESVLDQAKHHVVDLLSRLDAYNPNTYFEYSNGTYNQGFWFDDLFSFAYFQLARALVNDVEVRECDNCGYIFEVTHQRQRFCPPVPNRKRSSCEMAYNNRLKKEKKLKGEV